MLTRGQIAGTAAWLASVQLPSGAIPWEPGRHADPWDHVEAAMGLDVAGLHTEAARAYRWLAATQAEDGSWASAYVDGVVSDATSQSSHGSYVATGLWHHTQVTGDGSLLDELWPTVARALDWSLTLQAPDGSLAWARDPRGRLDRGPLVTGSSSTLLALRCGVLLAERVGDARPDWELSADRLTHVVQSHPEVFSNRARYAMDWYYPVLCGALRGGPARERIETGWPVFVRPGRGTRCVSDRPWFTPAETCELALALDVLGDRPQALVLLEAAQRLRCEDGSVWTGWVDDATPDGAMWPEERTTWTAAVLLLACDGLSDGAVSGSAAAAGLFRDRAVPSFVPCDESCPVPRPGSQAWADALQDAQRADLGNLLESP